MMACKYFLRKLKPTLAYHQFIGKNTPGVVLLSGFNSNMNGKKALALENWCRSNDYSFLRFDYRGTGESDGDMTTFFDWVEDASEIFSNVTKGPQVLVGSSMGANVMLHLHNRFPNQVVGLFGVAPSFYFVDNLRKWKASGTFKDGFFTYPSSYGDYRVPEVFFDESFLEKVDLFKNNQFFSLRCPLCIFHGMADESVPWQSSLKFVENSLKDESNEVRIVFRKSGEHRLSAEDDLRALIHELSFMIATVTKPSSARQSTL